MFIHVVIVFVIVLLLQGFNVVVICRCFCAPKILCCWCCCACCSSNHVFLLNINLLLLWNCHDFSPIMCLRSRQAHGKVWAGSVTWKSHTHSQECERMWGKEPTRSQVDSHFGGWIPMNFQTFREKFEGSKLSRLKKHLYH